MYDGRLIYLNFFVCVCVLVSSLLDSVEQTLGHFVFLQHYSVVILRVSDRREHLFKESGLPEAQTSTNCSAIIKTALYNCISEKNRKQTLFFMFHIDQNTVCIFKN